MSTIDVRDLTRIFPRFKSRPGVSGALRDLFGREAEQFVAVDHINLRVEPGEMVGYIGANGAGKSTTVKMLCGILVPTSGHLRVGGFEPARQREQYVRTIGAVFGQRSALWWDIAARETFRLLQRMYRVSDADFHSYFEQELVPVLGIDDLMHVPVRKLSLGQRMRCELAAALLHRPQILFLDEPTIGLDVVVKLRIREFLKEVNRRYGTTVLLTTHDLTDIEALCPRVVVLEQGKIVYDGGLQDLRQRFAGDRIVRVSFGEPVTTGAVQAALDGLPVAAQGSSDLEYRLRITAADLDLSALLARLLTLAPVRDVAVETASMEEIVAAVYRQGGAD